MSSLIVYLVENSETIYVHKVDRADPLPRGEPFPGRRAPASGPGTGRGRHGSSAAPAPAQSRPHGIPSDPGTGAVRRGRPRGGVGVPPPACDGMRVGPVCRPPRLGAASRTRGCGGPSSAAIFSAIILNQLSRGCKINIVRNSDSLGSTT